MRVTQAKAQIVGSSRITRNALWNIIGSSAPIVVAVVCIPQIVRGMGDERFGLLSIVWMLIGYFTIFDMGIGRALTRLAAERIGQGKTSELPQLFWTACVLMILLGTLGGIVLALMARWLSADVLRIPKGLQNESLRSFWAVSLSLPLIVMTTGLIGMLEARQRFARINLVRLPLGAFTFLGPLWALHFSNSLDNVVMFLLLGRVFECAIFFVLCLNDYPDLRRSIRLDYGEIRPLISAGTWITCSTLLLPALVHSDRFLIGSLVSVGAVTYYGTVSEILVKLLILPRALVSVLYPWYAAHYVQGEAETARMFARSLGWLLGIMVPVILITVGFASEGLALWLGSEFALKSAPVMRILATGVFFHCLTYIPFTYLQGIGRPDIPGRVHLVEFPLFILVAIPLILQWNINGAALAWAIRALAEFVIMVLFAAKYAPAIGLYQKKWAAGISLAVGLFVVISLVNALWGRVSLAILGLILWAAWSWCRMLDDEDRTALRKLIRALPPLR